MKRGILICSLALWSALAFALPSTDEVQAAVRAGNYPQADSMMHEVVAAKPQSAKAHYVYAEILAHEGKFADAAAQARSARELDPAIGFTDPAKFNSFEQELQRAQGQGGGAVSPQVIDQTAAPSRVPAERAGSGVPGWVWAGGIAVIAFFILRAVMRRTAGAGTGGGYVRQGSYPVPNQGYGPGQGAGYGYNNGPAPGGGALRTGLAAAGGLAAGMMAERFLEGRRDEANPGNGNIQPNWDNGQSSAAGDLENRSVDFGNGGGWDAGGSSDGGGFDAGGGGGDNGGGW